jgi:hypothetical protein
MEAEQCAQIDEQIDEGIAPSNEGQAALARMLDTQCFRLAVDALTGSTLFVDGFVGSGLAIQAGT